MWTLEQLERIENYQLHLHIHRRFFTLSVKVRGLEPQQILTSRGHTRVFKSLDSLYAALDQLGVVPSKFEISMQQ